jgi:two-component system chemotaxis sensor kinase CheA
MGNEIFINDPEILQEFIAESIEHLESTEPLLIELEDDPENLELLNAVFRSIHSIKGSAGFLGLKKIQKLSHKMEGILDDLRKGKREVSAEIMDLIFETSDVLKELIYNLQGETLIDGFSGEESAKRYDKLIKKIITLSGGTIAEKITAEIKDKKKEKPVKEPKKAKKPKQVKATKVKTKAKKEESVSFESLKDSKKMLSLFTIEAEEHIQTIEKDLLAIEKESDNIDTINGLFRAFHSIKGSAAYVNKQTISELSHNVESLLNVLRTEKLPVSKDLLDTLFEALDALKLMVEAIKDGEDESGKILAVVAAAKQKLLTSIEELEAQYKQGDEDKAGDEDTKMDDVFLDAASQYISSAASCLNNIKEGKLSVENTDTFIRSMDSLKKSASFMGFPEIAKTAELALDALTFVKNGQLSFEKEILDLLDEKIGLISQKISSPENLNEEMPEEKDKIGDILVDSGAASKESIDAALEKQKKLGDILKEDAGVDENDIAKALEKQKKVAASKDVSKKVEDIKTVRVDQNKIDKFMNLVGELIITRNSLFYQIGKLKSTSLTEMMKEIKYTTSVIFRISDELQTNVMKMRMVPIKTVFQRFPRMVRDLSRNSGKKVDIKLVGEDTEIDKTVAELLGDPLVHLVRNAVDHGIEPPEERIAAGKDETGVILLKAFQEGNVIIIDIIDDGYGMNPEAIKKKAIEKGVLTPESAEEMSKKEALNLIFHAGLSTAKKITDISGRGVGMDVVKTNIVKLKGRIDLSSDLGHGSKVRIELPLTLAIIKVLLIESAKEVFAMPLDSVVESVKILPHEIVKLRGKDVICLRGEILGITKLSYLLDSEKKNGDNIHHAIEEQLEVKSADELFEVAKEKERERLISADEQKIPIVILDVLNNKIGIVVDALQQQQEVVIKPMESYLAHIPGIGGATIMGDGRVVLILDPIELIKSATA